VSATDKQVTIDQLRAGVGALIEAIGEDLRRGTETESQFNLELLNRSAASLGTALPSLAPHAGLFDINLSYRVQDGSGTAALTPEGLRIDEWDRDPDLSPPPLDPEPESAFEALAGRLARVGDHLEPVTFLQDLDTLQQARASVEISLRVHLSKEDVVNALGLPDRTRGLLYVVTDRLLQRVRQADFATLDELLVPKSAEAVVILLGDACGIAKGPNIRICGREQWQVAGCLDFKPQDADREKLVKAIAFRDEECHWEIPMPGLSPHHLRVESTTLDQPGLLNALARHCDRLSAACLANRARHRDGRLVCEFRGHKRVRMDIPPLDKAPCDAPIFKLFSWAYENASSDKLGIVRQVISLQLEDKPARSYAALCQDAADILQVSKGNFDSFLRRSVELYFEKRMKVSEFLQKLNEEAGKSVSDLTSELVSDVYKTIGVILGAAIAALFDPKWVVQIILGASVLYVIYVLFILVYWLPAAFLRFRCKVQEYRHSVLKLGDVLTKEEIEALAGGSFDRVRRLFWVYFALTYLVYGVVGAMAFLIGIWALFSLL
jgi:hypothetical protein